MSSSLVDKVLQKLMFSKIFIYLMHLLNYSKRRVIREVERDLSAIKPFFILLKKMLKLVLVSFF